VCEWGAVGNEAKPNYDKPFKKHSVFLKFSLKSMVCMVN
jgi:hypothetical protein